MQTWSKGDQQRAEMILIEAAKRYPGDIRLALFFATCTRGRFLVERAAPIFRFVAEKGVVKGRPTTEAKIAACVLLLDTRQETEKAFGLLRQIVQENPKDPIPLWLLAIQYRTYERYPEGAAAYKRLIGLVGTGSALVHQSYANILDALKRYPEALESRMIAVRLEPAWWSLHGLAETLYHMERYADSEKAARRATELFPDSYRGWNDLADALLALDCSADAARAYAKAIAVAEKTGEPWRNHANAYNNWGVCLENLNRFPEALEKYRRAIEIDPKDPDFYNNSADMLEKLGRKAEAAEMRGKARERGAR
jgi:tetratricopeptide (TPR) repeat protein